MANLGAIDIDGFADLELKRAIVEEGMSASTASQIEFLSKDRALVLGDMVGKPVTIKVDMIEGTPRSFLGTCVEAEYIGIYRAHGLYRIEVRPWLWFLTRTRECKVYQDVSTVDIIQTILGDYGFSSYLEKKLSGTYAARDFCLQYRETDLDFINRLMEEEGIYYFFSHRAGTEKMVLADSAAAHEKVPLADSFKFTDNRGLNPALRDEYVYELSAKECVTTGKVTLNDYNFETPKRDMKVSRAMFKGSHGHKSHEFYDYLRHYSDTGRGESFSRVRMEAEACRYQTWAGAASVKNLSVGETVSMTDHDQTSKETNFLITRATHFIQTSIPDAEDDIESSILGKLLPFDPENRDPYRCLFEVVPSNIPYRAPLKTPWPEMQGIQTAVVVGPKGEEIHTDKYGRVRIQFHWDRLGKKDETSSVWVRAMTPWSGKNWGVVAVLRIGQEVVVQFEEGNPDRPVILGMLYNADTMPPYALPENKTQSGVKTNSTKGGGGFNELMFEDMKGAELVRFQSEKDYRQIVKNDAEITIGLEKMDKGDLTQTIHRHKTETLKTGDMTFAVEAGKETRTIAKDQDQTIGANQTENIGSNRTQQIGNNSTVSVGNNMNLTVGSNLKEDVGQVITITAGVQITLKVGASFVKINNSGVTIQGPVIKLKGAGMIKAQSPMTQVKGDAMLVLKGGLTLIN